MREVVSWGELPGVFQVEPNCTGVTLRRWYKATECTLSKLHWTIVDLETTDWKSPTVKWRKQNSVINEGKQNKTLHSRKYRLFFFFIKEYNCNRNPQV